MGRSLRKKVAKGELIVVRYADDLVVGFQHRTDAERFLWEFRKRLAKFRFGINADKTRLIEFGRFAAEPEAARRGKPETFTFLGFTPRSVGSSPTELSSSGDHGKKRWSRS